MFTIKSESLCNSHNTILYWVREVKKILKRENIDKEKSLKEAFEILDMISSEARVAKKKGQHMENRLKKYRNSVESLGFKRIGG